MQTAIYSGRNAWEAVLKMGVPVSMKLPKAVLSFWDTPNQTMVMFQEITEVMIFG